MNIKFRHILGVRIAEWMRKIDSARWKKEWLQMNEIEKNRYAFVLRNYRGFVKKKIN